MALAVAAAGVFASVGMAGFGSGLVGLSHSSATPTTDQYPTSKVTICHHTHSQKNPFVTITVSEHAVAAHVRNHGDTIGPCSEAPPASALAPAAKAHEAQKAKSAKLHLKGNSKGKHEGQGKDDGAMGAGHQPTTGPSTAEHGQGQGKGHTKTHGPPADRGQGNANGHSQDKGQKDNGHGQGHDNGDLHGNGGNGKGH